VIFDEIVGRFQLKLKNREAAANILGSALKDIVNENELKINSIVLGVPRGGVIMGYIIYKKLNAGSFDIIMPRRLCAPFNRELSIGSIMRDGTNYLNHFVIENLGISSDYVEKEKEVQKNEISRQERLYPIRYKEEEIRNRTVILADDGAATGATLIVALRWIRKQNPKKIIVAVTVAPKETVKFLKEEADHVEVIISPKTSNFKCVEQYYRSFYVVSDNEIIQIMKKE